LWVCQLLRISLEIRDLFVGAVYREIGWRAP
jgi:hypothetical protein